MNFVVKPIVKVISFPLFIFTLGLITLVVNALMLLLTSWLAGTSASSSMSRASGPPCSVA